MKKTLFHIIALSGLALASSCQEEFLEVVPETQVVSSAFYKTKAHFEEAVNGAYAPLQGIHTGGLWALAEMRSDNTSYQYNTGDRSGSPREELDEFRELDDNNTVGPFFNGSYNGIFRCNMILSRLEQVELSEADENLFAGQARFLRGYYYFNLVRLFGDVPLVLRESTSPNDAFSNASPVASDLIYEQIITDLREAARLLPPSFAAVKDKGRATKGAALALLAKVYMTRGAYNEALLLLREVTQLGYSLLPNYADLFDAKNKNNAESVFEVQYVEGNYGEHSNFIYTFAPYNSGSEVAQYGVQSGAAAGWNIPTQDMLDAYEPGDNRKDASVGVYVKNGVTVPYIRKYVNPHAVRYQTNDNWPVIRYADVLLMLAESLNEVAYQPGGEAFQVLNQVRQRAGLPELTAEDLPNQQAFREAVARERRVELAFENHRWFDLLRTGKAAEVMQAHAAREKALKPHVLGVSYGNIRSTYQYPRRETQLLTQ